MERNERIVVGAATFLLLYTVALNFIGPVVYSALTNKTIPSTGSVEPIGVGVYWDQDATSTVSSIDWGVLQPDANASKTIYIRNEGDTAIALDVTTSDWNPTGTTNYMTLNWNYGGQRLGPDQVIPVEITLAVSASITGITDFSFQIIITATTE